MRIKIKPLRILKTVAAVGAPEAISATTLHFRTATITGNKDEARTLNAGNVFLGFMSTNGKQAWKVEPGKSYEIVAPEDQEYDFNELYCDVENAGDGVVIDYS